MKSESTMNLDIQQITPFRAWGGNTCSILLDTGLDSIIMLF